jgi:hypothetical protein
MTKGKQVLSSQPVVRYYKSVRHDLSYFPADAVPLLTKIEGLDLEAPLTDELQRLFPDDPWMFAPTPTFVDVAYAHGDLRPARYGIGRDGSLGDLYGHGFHPRASVMDLVRACQDGMNQGNPETLVLFCPWGGGGNGIGNLWTLWFENPYGQFVGGLLAEALAVRALAATRTVIRSPDQIVAMTWVEEQGLTSPAALREAVDKKHVWKAPMLAKRLRITTEASEFLLARLGYARRPLTETWERSRTFEAKKMRTEWKKAENPFDTKHSRRRSKKRKRRGKTKERDE